MYWLPDYYDSLNVIDARGSILSYDTSLTSHALSSVNDDNDMLDDDVDDDVEDRADDMVKASGVRVFLAGDWIRTTVETSAGDEK